MKFILFASGCKWTALLLLDDFAKNKGKGGHLNFKFLAHQIWNEYLKMNNKIRPHFWKIFLLAEVRIIQPRPLK